MNEFHLNTEVWLARPREEVFAFFSEARNLEVLTPPWLRFRVLTPAPVEMGLGTLIDYRMRVHGFQVHWRTEITAWNPPYQLIDEQVRGPYTLWRHTHTFTEKEGGTLCRDNVRYRPRGGGVTNWLFVRRDVERIFDYRQKRLREMFGETA